MNRTTCQDNPGRTVPETDGQQPPFRGRPSAVRLSGMAVMDTTEIDR